MRTQSTEGPTRRTLIRSAGWAAPLVAASAAVPAYASSTKTDLAIEVVDPPYNWETFEPEHRIPIFRGPSGNNERARGSLPPSIRITNVGRVPATNPSGTVEITMRDYGSDYAPVGANQVKANTVNGRVVWAETGTPLGSRYGSKFTYTYRTVLHPGQTVEIPLRYYVNQPFANVQFNLLVAATVVDQHEGDYDDNSERLGHVPWFFG